MNLQKLADHQDPPTGKIWLSYFPCLGTAPGEWIDSSRLKLLQDAQVDLKNVISVGWNNVGEETIPVLYIKYAEHVVPHLKEFIRSLSFTFVWEVKKDNRYSLAIIPTVNHAQNAVYWAWSFNSAGPSTMPVRELLKAVGDQRVCFADVDTKKIFGVFAFPARRKSLIPKSDQLSTQADCYIFQK